MSRLDLGQTNNGKIAFPADGKVKDIKIGDSIISYQVSVFDNSTVYISSLRTPTTKRRKGSARAAMEQFLRMTDDACLNTKLASSPLDKKTNGYRLYNFYVSLGYAPTGRTINFVGDPEMTRAATKHKEYQSHAENDPVLPNPIASQIGLVNGDLISDNNDLDEGMRL